MEKVFFKKIFFKEEKVNMSSGNSLLLLKSHFKLLSAQEKAQEKWPDEQIDGKKRENRERDA